MPYLAAAIIGLILYNGFAVFSLLPKNPSPTAPTINVTSYINQKGKIADKPETFFATLITQPTVLGTTTQVQSEATSAANTDETGILAKSNIKVALLGDSMFDTLGPGLPDLQKSLASRLPHVKFSLLNYGAGATSIETGLAHLTNSYTYLGENKPAILTQNPDIIVVESFAYNHWGYSQSDLDRQWLTIVRIIDTIKNYNQSTKIVLAAATSPYCPTFTDGSANLPPDRKYKECETVKAYLQNMVNFATSQNYPLADAYSPSLIGNEGNSKFINQGDHIHPSGEGKKLISESIARAIDLVIN